MLALMGHGPNFRPNRFCASPSNQSALNLPGSTLSLLCAIITHLLSFAVPLCCCARVLSATSRCWLLLTNSQQRDSGATAGQHRARFRCHRRRCTRHLSAVNGIVRLGNSTLGGVSAPSLPSPGAPSLTSGSQTRSRPHCHQPHV